MSGEQWKCYDDHDEAVTWQGYTTQGAFGGAAETIFQLFGYQFNTNNAVFGKIVCGKVLLLLSGKIKRLGRVAAGPCVSALVRDGTGLLHSGRQHHPFCHPLGHPVWWLSWGSTLGLVRDLITKMTPTEVRD